MVQDGGNARARTFNTHNGLAMTSDCGSIVGVATTYRGTAMSDRPYSEFLQGSLQGGGAHLVIDNNDFDYLNALGRRMVTAWDAREEIRALPMGPEPVWPGSMHPALLWAESYVAHADKLRSMIARQGCPDDTWVQDFIGHAAKWLVVQEVVWAVEGVYDTDLAPSDGQL